MKFNMGRLPLLRAKAATAFRAS